MRAAPTAFWMLASWEGCGDLFMTSEGRKGLPWAARREWFAGSQPGH